MAKTRRPTKRRKTTKRRTVKKTFKKRAGNSYKGYGAYRRRSGPVIDGQIPSIQNSMHGVIVRHKEYIGDIGPSVLFTPRSYPIQPGSDVTFPWLSQIAPAFTEYRWRGIMFTYKTTSSDLVTSTNPSLGSVIMATDYNAAEEPFIDKRSMENFEYSNSSKPSMSFAHMVECEKAQTAHPTLYTRTAPPPPNADIRLYDIGTFTIATQGMQATVPEATIGELWCSYEIELFKPRFDVDAGIEDDSWANFQSTAAQPTGTLNAELNLVNSLGVTISQTVANDGSVVITFPLDSSGKTFEIFYLVQGTSVSTGSVDQAVFTKSDSPLVKLDGGQGNITLQNATAPAKFLLWNCVLQIGNIQNSINLPFIKMSFPTNHAAANWPVQPMVIERLDIMEIDPGVRIFV